MPCPLLEHGVPCLMGGVLSAKLSQCDVLGVKFPLSGILDIKTFSVYFLEVKSNKQAVGRAGGRTNHL